MEPWPASLSARSTVPQARVGELLVLERWARTRSLSPWGASATAASAACRFERWPYREEIRRFRLAEYGPRLSQSGSWFASMTTASAPLMLRRTLTPATPRSDAIAPHLLPA